MTLAKRDAMALAKAGPILGYWPPADVAKMVDAARRMPRNGERNALLLRTLFVGSLRVSEGLMLTPLDVRPGPQLNVRRGKGGKGRPVAITPALADSLLAFARRRKIADDQAVFDLSRYQVLRIVKACAKAAGVEVSRTRTHLLRHSGAIERLRQTGNPRALQLHLGHSSPATTMRYLTTLQVEDAVRIQQGVDPER